VSALYGVKETKCQYSETFSETRHEAVIQGNKIAYKAVAGNFLLKNQKCEPTASLFFVSYTKEGSEDLERPVTFCFNGGPGSSSVWLHLGMFGPKRVLLSEQGDSMPPYQLVNNDYSLLDLTDLVFIDPVSTGFSQSIPPENAKNFHGVEEDIKSIAEFIRLYLTRFDRWQSPKFIAGESYGTTRAAGLAGHLHDQHYINVNGIILISSILNFNSFDFSPGNDLGPLLFFPTYTATAWYHRKLAPELLNLPLADVLQKSIQFVENSYIKALFRGSNLSQADVHDVALQMSRLTSLKPEYIARSNLRIDDMRFMKELLRGQNQTVGRFDSRILGTDGDSLRLQFEYDPSINAIFSAFTGTFNHYIRNDLKWESSKNYEILTSVHPWDYGSGHQCFNVADTLSSAMIKNAKMTIFVASGYYDLATPFYATEYTFSHLNLPRPIQEQVTMKNYEAGHMMYIFPPVLKKLKSDLADYYIRTLKKQEDV
jgi:carboxypeptidase C (cathepsin A)